MASYLLATKLRIPPQSDHVVRRARLDRSLEQAIPRYKLVLLAAPAGYGKTTALAQWARASRYPVAWLSVSDDDNDIEQFFRYLLAAWERVQPSIRDSPLDLLLGAMSPDIEAVLAAFINAADDVPDHTVFVLDDIHLIEDAAIHQALTFLLDHLPPTLHFVLAGRGEPPLPLARYRARHELLELRTEDLHFRLNETADFLNRHMGLDLTQDEIVPLQAQLEGWIAGLQLAALTLQRQRETPNALVIGGRHRFIADYLTEDVFAYLPNDIRWFLLQTSILDRLCGTLCDAVTGRADGQEMLERLERANLFLMPLDDSREWYRYHRLFADFLQAELLRRYPEDVDELHRRAACWYAAHDQPEPAFQHALAAEDVEPVIQIFERYFFPKLLGAEFKLLQRWLESIPAAWYSAYPVLGLARVGFLMHTGATDAGARYLNEVEQRVKQQKNEDRRRNLARVTAIRCFIACFQNDMALAQTYADQALRDLPEEDFNFRPGIFGALGDTYRRNGYWREAHEWYLKVLDFTHSPTVRIESVHLFGALADLDLRQGHLRAAAEHWRRALTVIQGRENWGHLPLPEVGWVYVRMGELQYEQNELADAWEYVSRGLEHAELCGDVRAMFAGYLIAGRSKLTTGDLETAAEYLERARPLVENAAFPDWYGRFERFQVEVWLAQDRLRSAVTWADELLRDDGPAVRSDSEVMHLTVARVLIVKGDAPSIAQALVLLERLLEAAKADGRMGAQIEALALQSLAYSKRGETPSAMIALENALHLAEPQGYVRLFADLGLPMVRLLQEARSRGVMPDYVAKLLAATGTDLASPVPAERALPEPLTQREQEILGLLAAGLMNLEIAEQLSISPETVKKHTGNIYGKLGVRSRTQAVARARDLDLLN